MGSIRQVNPLNSPKMTDYVDIFGPSKLFSSSNPRVKVGGASWARELECFSNFFGVQGFLKKKKIGFFNIMLLL